MQLFHAVQTSEPEIENNEAWSSGKLLGTDRSAIGSDRFPGRRLIRLPTGGAERIQWRTFANVTRRC